MSDAIKQAEQRGYSRGYQAGRKRAVVDEDAGKRYDEKLRAERLFRQQVFCAALQGTIVSGDWRTGDKRWSNYSEFVRGCKSFADEAVNQFRGEVVA